MKSEMPRNRPESNNDPFEIAKDEALSLLYEFRRDNYQPLMEGTPEKLNVGLVMVDNELRREENRLGEDRFAAIFTFELHQEDTTEDDLTDKRFSAKDVKEELVQDVILNLSDSSRKAFADRLIPRALEEFPAVLSYDGHVMDVEPMTDTLHSMYEQLTGKKLV